MTKDWRGIRNLVAAELQTDTAQAIAWGAPFPLCAVSKLAKSTESSTASKHYSNRSALHRRSRGADEVSIDASGIADDKRARALGEVYDEALGLYVAGNPGRGLLALGYIIKDTNGVEYGVWRLKGVMSYPETEHNTDDDGTDSAGETLTYTGQQTLHKFAYRGKAAKAVRIPLDKFPGGEAAFFAQVQTPDTIAAALAGGDEPAEPDAPAAAMYLYGTPSQVSYNGTVLPDIGEIVAMAKAEGLEYALVHNSADGYLLFLASQPTTINNDYNAPATYYPKGTAYAVFGLTDGAWEYGAAAEIGDVGRMYPVNSIPVIWSNHDILNEDGSVYLAASEPVHSGNIGLRVGESVTYYDGMILPELPEWDKTEYPYAVINYSYKNGVLNKVFCRILASNAYYTPSSVGGVWFGGDADGSRDDDKVASKYYQLTGDVWGEPSETEDGVVKIYPPEGQTVYSLTYYTLWANFKVKYDGVVYKQAFEPIPVGEIVDTINNIPIYEVI